MKRIKIAFIYFVILLMWRLSFAIDIPKEVYRVDSRPPEVIFASGFNSWGNNDSLLDHVIGDSLAESNSAFVATSGNLRAALNFAVSEFAVTGSNFWLYRIEPDGSFWNINTSLEYIAETASDSEARTAGMALITYSQQEEWVALRQVPTTLIHSATRYRVIGRRPVEIESSTEENPHFFPSSEVPNSGPYISTQDFNINATVHLVQDRPVWGECLCGVQCAIQKPFNDIISASKGGSCDKPKTMSLKDYERMMDWRSFHFLNSAVIPIEASTDLILNGSSGKIYKVSVDTKTLTYLGMPEESTHIVAIATLLNYVYVATVTGNVYVKNLNKDDKWWLVSPEFTSPITTMISIYPYSNKYKWWRSLSTNQW